ncbi:hypothetical protein IX321_000722 [Bacteroides pyogenes]|nr:hypothetical protein [Bacteroides pyogenes]MBR8716569.1 hypothetical protein [Bacteroides pyogenes]MBR8746325.1 hypothetical protein [Bacteroides pyogenes]MBR8756585.1 hypothetical protein [Bacteroides pyogenes]MBR8779823.1 hypothetical protein [Bacteroides pyogenes]
MLFLINPYHTKNKIVSACRHLRFYDERVRHFVATAFVKIGVIFGISGFSFPKNYSEGRIGLKRVASAKAICLRTKNAFA